MATIVGPFFSVTASGSVANILTASDWKGIAVMKIYTAPVNQQTPEQTAHRTLYSQAIHAWRNYLRNPNRNLTWNRLAKTFGTPLSGYNAAVSSMIPVIRDTPEKAMAVTMNYQPMGPNGSIYCDPINVLTNHHAPPGMPVQWFFGKKANQLLFSATSSSLQGNVPYPRGTTFYVAFMRGGVWRSGVWKFKSF